MRRIGLAVLIALLIGLAGASPPIAAAPGAGGSAPECPQQLPGPRAVVRLAYLTLLRRCPDASGAASWEAALRDGMTARTFARRIASTPEARGVVVADAYTMVLGRRAGPGEKAFWAGWLRPDPTRSRRHDQLLAELAASGELYAAAGRSDGRVVDLVYERILGRRASDDDRGYWVARLRRDGDRRALARTLLRLDEPLGATVVAAWGEVLGTAPTPAQRGAETARLRADGDRLGLSARLVGSAAFRARADAGALVVPGRYVALGDSYVVGEGLTPPVVDDAPGCGHSEPAYPEVARTSSELVPGTLDMAACTGASLSSLYPVTFGDETFPGQIDALADGPSPDLVTVTIGGNDIGFLSLITTCLQVWAGTTQLNGGYDARDCDRLLDIDAPRAIDVLRHGDGRRDCDGHTCSLPAAVADIVAAAPDADVVVVGYPPLMPSSDSGCTGAVTQDGRTIDGVEWRFAARDVRRGRAIIAALDDVLHDAAIAAGATYADPASLFQGHAACSADPWIGGLDLDGGGNPNSSSFHPNRRGGVALAGALIDAL